MTSLQVPRKRTCTAKRISRRWPGRPVGRRRTGRAGSAHEGGDVDAGFAPRAAALPPGAGHRLRAGVPGADGGAFFCADARRFAGLRILLRIPHRPRRAGVRRGARTRRRRTRARPRPSAPKLCAHRSGNRPAGAIRPPRRSASPCARHAALTSGHSPDATQPLRRRSCKRHAIGAFPPRLGLRRSGLAVLPQPARGRPSAFFALPAAPLRAARSEPSLSARAPPAAPLTGPPFAVVSSRSQPCGAAE